VRRLILLAVLSLGLAACGSSGTPATGPGQTGHPIQVEFGVTGGNIVPFTISISPDGKINEQGTLRVGKKHVASATVASLSDAVRSDLPGLSDRQCKGTLPDVGSRFIKADGKTVTVHGSCEAGFERLWSQLTAAAGLD
jgi:hypothetical protein